MFLAHGLMAQWAELQVGKWGFYSRVDGFFLIEEGVVERLQVCRGEKHELEKVDWPSRLMFLTLTLTLWMSTYCCSMFSHIGAP